MPRNFTLELLAARSAQDWNLHAQIWEERSFAEVDYDEHILFPEPLYDELGDPIPLEDPEDEELVLLMGEL